MKKSTKFLTAAGLITGTMLGSLLTPRKGSENRKQLYKQLHRLAAVLNGKHRKEKLLIAKEKLQQHKLQVEKRIQCIEASLAAYDQDVYAGT